jgi:hypothetical protein
MAQHMGGIGFTLRYPARGSPQEACAAYRPQARVETGPSGGRRRMAVRQKKLLR